MKFLSLVGISLRFHTLSFFFLFFFSVMFSFLHAAACYLFYSGQLFFFTTLLPESQENDINSRDKTFLETGTAIPTFANNLPPSRISLPVEKVSLFYKNIVNRISLALQPKGKEDNFLTTFEYYDRSSPFFSFLFLLFTISWTLKISKDLIISQPVISNYLILLCRQILFKKGSNEPECVRSLELNNR